MINFLCVMLIIGAWKCYCDTSARFRVPLVMINTLLKMTENFWFPEIWLIVPRKEKIFLCPENKYTKIWIMLKLMIVACHNAMTLISHWSLQNASLINSDTSSLCTYILHGVCLEWWWWRCCRLVGEERNHASSHIIQWYERQK